jgi:uncharacterized protein
MNRTEHRSSTRSNPTPSDPSAVRYGARSAASPAFGLQLDRRTVVRYATAVVATGVLLLTIPVVADLPVEAFLLSLVYVVYLGGAVLVARRTGPGGIRRLFAGVLRWQIGWRNWVLVVGAIPLATLAVALVTGTLSAPADGWPVTVGNYLFVTFVFGALILNIFEETAWQGLVQRNLTRDHGSLRAAMLTSVPFAAVHIPLSFVGDATINEALGATALLFVFAPAMRYLMGRTDLATGGSLLAVGVMHASFNASGQLGVTGEWQHIAGLALVAGLALATDLRRTGSKLASGIGGA